MNVNVFVLEIFRGNRHVIGRNYLPPLCVATLIFASSAYAENGPKQMIGSHLIEHTNISILAGGGWTSFKSSNAVDTLSRMGGSVLAIAHYTLPIPYYRQIPIAMEAGLGYAYRGTDRRVGIQELSERTVGYLEVPILASVGVGDKILGKVEPAFQMGFSVAFRLHHNGFTNSPEFMDRAFVLGSRVAFHVAPSKSVEVGFQYSIGLNNISNDIGLDNQNVSVYKNRTALLMVGFRWSPGKDFDQDRILDANDVCPRQPDDHDALIEPGRIGCPESDFDQDRALDVDDKCPRVAEDIDGFEDQDGCPDPDNDQDGILDVADKCPLKSFPTQPNGCPPTYEWIEVTETAIKLTKQSVLFDNKKANLKDEYKAIVDEVAKALDDYPKIRLRIEGHADGEGSTRRNEQLSQQRADAVRDYLTKVKQVDGDRLVAKGYGEEQPRHNEKTPEAKANNRRVEFAIIPER